MTLPNDKRTKGKTERGATKQRYKISDNHEVLYGSAAAATVNFKENYRFGEKKGKTDVICQIFQAIIQRQDFSTGQMTTHL